MALEGFTPAALRGVTLHTAGELGWSDVGGLAAVKGALMETLLWPTKVCLTVSVRSNSKQCCQGNNYSSHETNPSSGQNRT